MIVSPFSFFQAEVEAALDKVCDFLPSTIKTDVRLSPPCRVVCVPNECIVLAKITLLKISLYSVWNL